MTEQLCPVCGCSITGEGYEKENKTYCCEPCASKSSNSCECGCCHTADQSQE